MVPGVYRALPIFLTYLRHRLPAIPCGGFKRLLVMRGPSDKGLERRSSCLRGWLIAG